VCPRGAFAVLLAARGRPQDALVPTSGALHGHMRDRGSIGPNAGEECCGALSEGCGARAGRQLDNGR
jgi:hypothetical protein